MFTEFHGNRFIIDGEINEKHALLVSGGIRYNHDNWNEAFEVIDLTPDLRSMNSSFKKIIIFTMELLISSYAGHQHTKRQPARTRGQ